MNRISGKTTSIVIFAIVFAVFSLTLCLVCPISSSTWVVLAFGLLQTVLVSFGISKVDKGTEGLFKVYPILLIPTICYVAQLLSGIVLCVASPGNHIAVLLVGVVLTAASVASLLGVSKSMQYANGVEKTVAMETECMRNLLLSLQAIKATNRAMSEAETTLDGLIEKVRFSDTHSNDAVIEIDRLIDQALIDLESGPEIGVMQLEELIRLVDLRNVTLKSRK